MTTMPTAAWDLAGRAADRIVGRAAHPSVARAVLAQWIAEHGEEWPFSRNNPGNVAQRWARSVGATFSVDWPNPQPGNPIVTFASQAAGADAYAAGLVAFDRYNQAILFARAGRGLDFAVENARAGYGTRESAIRTVYAALAAPGGPSPTPQPGGENVAIRWAQVQDTATRIRLRAHQPIHERPGGPIVTTLGSDASVPHIGLAGSAGGQAWRAVLIGTRWSYSDGDSHSTILYVPADAGEVVPG